MVGPFKGLLKVSDSSTFKSGKHQGTEFFINPEIKKQISSKGLLEKMQN
jgi:hypothetical protein